MMAEGFGEGDFVIEEEFLDEEDMEEDFEEVELE